jgi:hypothetical protein
MLRQDPRRVQSTLDKFVGEDPLWMALVADEQYANREGQLLGIAVLIQEQQQTNKLLEEILEVLEVTFQPSRRL